MKIALVGRTNVGKSTLFNALTQTKKALVADIDGVTRDYQQALWRLDGKHIYELVDTPGYEKSTDNIWPTIEQAVQTSDLIFLVVDGQCDPHIDDIMLARFLQKQKALWTLVINKVDHEHLDISSFYKLGHKDIQCVSSIHNHGIFELGTRTIQHLGAYVSHQPEKPNLHLAIIGKPNVGKSTFLNGVLGEERVRTGDEPGLTRDSIHTDILWNKQHAIRLVDTAGIKRHARQGSLLDKKAYQETQRVIRYAHAILLVIDGSKPIDRQDLRIANSVVEEGRLLFILVNKKDCIDSVDLYRKNLLKDLAASLHQVKHIPIFFASALHKKIPFSSIMTAALELEERWRTRIPTGKLNQWLQDATGTQQPPLHKGRRLKLKYMTQVKSAPPTFLIFTNDDQALPKSYIRYLTNSLAHTFNLQTVPLRFQLKKTANPYA